VTGHSLRTAPSGRESWRAVPGDLAGRHHARGRHRLCGV